jgi:hypothetical protein
MIKRRNRWILLSLFSVLAIAAASVGFISLQLRQGVGRTLIFVFIGLCVVLFIGGLYFGRKPPPVPPDPGAPPMSKHGSGSLKL